MKIIAETAWHHDGDIGFLKALVSRLVSETSADYIKFHISLDSDEYIHTDHPAYGWVKDRLLTTSQWSDIIRSVIDSGKKIMLLFNDRKSIDFGMRFNPELVEIHSVCLNDIYLLEHLKGGISSVTSVVVGVGGSTIYEIENAIEVLSGKNIVLMHGFQNYPTKYTDINLGKIKKLMQLFPQYKHGYADHTAWDNENNILITLFGASLGMDYIEKHVTIVNDTSRTDWQAAITIDHFNELTDKLSLLNQCFGGGLLELNAGEKAYSSFGLNKKAAILVKNVEKGDTFSISDICFKRTGQSSDLSQIEVIKMAGRKYTRDITMGNCINKTDLL